MFFRRLIAEYHERRLIESLAQTVAESSAESIVRLVAGVVSGMTPREVRGYIRARGAGQIRRQTSAVLAELPNAMRLEAAVTQQAAERATILASRKLLAARARRASLSVSAATRRAA